MSDYWEDCVAEAFGDAGINATKDQIDTVISWVEGAHDNFSEATGLDILNRDHISDEQRELEQLKKQIQKRDNWINETEPCSACITTGNVLDIWGRNSTCPSCNGEGRI